jgi:signal transduction histidine kinase
MIRLVPTWAYDYKEFWETIRNRNIWFIHIRYGAIIMLIAIYLIAVFVMKLNFSPIQAKVIIGILFFITGYNLFLSYLRKYLTCTPGKFNPLHFSLLQMVLDLLTLMVLVYFTGSIETPLYMLFIFHMIIGSLILPANVIYSIATIITVVFTAIVVGEYNSIIPHHHISGLFTSEERDNWNFIFATLGIFIFTIYTTVLITNRIARKLYEREQELKETLDKLNEAEKIKQKYLMGVVHEIKTPIVAAQSIIEVITNGYYGNVDKKIEDKLLRIKIRTDEALTLINNILRISKLKLFDEISKEKVDVLEIINNVIGKHKEALQRKNIKLIINDYIKEKTVVKADSVLLELVFSNILGNAIKYSIANREIEILLKYDLANLVIEFNDMGIGIPEKDLKNIFKQFYRASNISTGQYEGSGLGLTLVKEIVERFEGNIEVISPSKLGDDEFPGTTVKVILPLFIKE